MFSVTCRHPHSTPVVDSICTRMRARESGARGKSHNVDHVCMFREKQWN